MGQAPAALHGLRGLLISSWERLSFGFKAYGVEFSNTEPSLLKLVLYTPGPKPATVKKSVCLCTDTKS